MSIFGFLGFIGSGKGAAGDICAHFGYQKMAFADPLKDATAAIFNWPRHMLEGDTEESRAWREQPDAFWSKVMGREFTPREALQKMGTEAGRNVFHKDLWVKSVEKRITNSGKKNIVITDVRFDNEVRTIQELGGKVIWIRRGQLPEWFDKAQTTVSGGSDQVLLDWAGKKIHRSEWDWVNSPIDFVIENDGTIADLENKLLKMIVELEVKPANGATSTPLIVGNCVFMNNQIHDCIGSNF